MQTKKCPKCKETKNIEEFHRQKSSSDGHHAICKECAKLYSRIYYGNHKEHYKELWEEYKLSNPEKLDGRGKIYYQNNKEKCKIASSKWCEEHPIEVKERKRIYHIKNFEREKEVHKIWLKNNPDKVKEHNKTRYQKNKNNLKVKLNTNMRKGINESLKSNKNGLRWESIVDYSLEDLMRHLEGLFTEDMSWSNYGEWHVDHILPISLWQFDSYNDIEFKQCWSLTNLQPLWAIDNLKKGNKILI